MSQKMQEKDGTYFVKSHDVRKDSEYIKWFVELKERYKSSQVKVNSEQFLFNWQLGRDLVERRAEEKWGKGVVEQVSLDLQAEFPDVKGFSVRNLWNMKKWYAFYASKAEMMLAATDKAYASLEGMVSITVYKATPTITTAPTAISNLSYTGSAQELINGGSVTGRRRNLNYNTLRRKDDFIIFVFSKKVLIKQDNFKKGVNNVEAFATSRVGTLEGHIVCDTLLHTDTM